MECKRPRPCGIHGCPGTHHALLHHQQETTQGNEAHVNSSRSKCGQVALGVITVNVLDRNGTKVSANLFFDEGSDKTFVREGLLSKLQFDDLRTGCTNNLQQFCSWILIASFGCSFCGCVSAAVVRTCSNCSLVGAVLLGLTDVVLSLFAELINDSWYCEFNGPISLDDAAGDASEITADKDSSDCNLSIELGESDSASTSSEAGASSDDAIVCNGTVLANESEMDIVEGESREADLAKFENVFKEILACTVHNDDSAVEDVVADKWPYETVFDNIRKKKAWRQSFRH
uniref:Peptidase A2 domain-containing protein n=1 Tax=Trichuris muris TaxID=70415 RepID=A0A5S6Q2F3_TRIMR